ncbi:hypothetical protein K438DRAFT_1749952, partial [Mycena galopus ATCC 62051]
MIRIPTVLKPLGIIAVPLIIFTTALSYEGAERSESSRRDIPSLERDLQVQLLQRYDVELRNFFVSLLVFLWGNKRNSTSPAISGGGAHLLYFVGSVPVIRYDLALQRLTFLWKGFISRMSLGPFTQASLAGTPLSPNVHNDPACGWHELRSPLNISPSLLFLHFMPSIAGSPTLTVLARAYSAHHSLRSIHSRTRNSRNALHLTTGLSFCSAMLAWPFTLARAHRVLILPSLCYPPSSRTHSPGCRDSCGVHSPSKKSDHKWQLAESLHPLRSLLNVRHGQNVDLQVAQRTAPAQAPRRYGEYSARRCPPISNSATSATANSVTTQTPGGGSAHFEEVDQPF